MTDTTKLTEQDGEEELIPVETPIDHEQDIGGKADDAEDEGDERIAESDDDLDADAEDGNGAEESEENSARKRRLKRRQQQRAARERTEAELRMLREQNERLQQQVQQIAGHTTQSAVQSLEKRYQEIQQDIRMAESIMAKAVEAGAGDDLVKAQQIRDEALAEAQRVAAQHSQLVQQAQAPAAPPPAVSYAQQWAAANDWFDPRGADEDSRLAQRIDREMAAEGWNPNTREYWVELTNRCKDAFEEGENEGKSVTSSKPKKAPPTGQSREHVPTSTRKEIYVTPERKQAMIEAGAWDDPVKRQRMLKRYREYDQTSAR